MVTKELTIINKLGIHARPAAQFVKLALSLIHISEPTRLID